MPADLHTELKKKYAVQTNPQANRGADDDEDESTSKTRVQSRYMEWQKKGASPNFKKSGTSNSKSKFTKLKINKVSQWKNFVEMFEKFYIWVNFKK